MDRVLEEVGLLDGDELGDPVPDVAAVEDPEGEAGLEGVAEGGEDDVGVVLGGRQQQAPDGLPELLLGGGVGAAGARDHQEEVAEEINVQCA